MNRIHETLLIASSRTGVVGMRLAIVLLFGLLGAVLDKAGVYPGVIVACSRQL